LGVDLFIIGQQKNSKKVACGICRCPCLDGKSWQEVWERAGSCLGLEAFKKGYSLEYGKDIPILRGIPYTKIRLSPKGGYPMMRMVLWSSNVVAYQEKYSAF